MNTEINNQLLTDGYYITKLNTEVAEKVKEIFSKIKDIEFRDAIHTNCGELGYTNNTDFETLEKLKKEYAPLKQWQFWYVENSLGKYISNEEIEYIKENVFRNLIKQCYEASLYNLEMFNLSYTMYNKQCYINPHSDGLSTYKLCNILLYLNEDYEDGFGGELIVNDNVIIKPEFGTIAVLDFTKVNPKHEVTEVIHDTFKRFAILTSFIYNNK
jgi:Rps23 Pro-64 3,4-dihydroxylase Tpa1-like proline 4-hydroxylase